MRALFAFVLLTSGLLFSGLSAYSAEVKVLQPHRNPWEPRIYDPYRTMVADDDDAFHQLYRCTAAKIGIGGRPLQYRAIALTRRAACRKALYRCEVSQPFEGRCYILGNPEF